MTLFAHKPKCTVISVWAKSLESNLKRQIAYCTQYNELIQIIMNSNVIIDDLCFVTQDVCMVAYHCTQESVNYLSPTPVNVIVGAWTLSHARLVLYSYLGKFPPKNLLYCDTDSIVIKSDPEISRIMAPHIGEGIGMLKDEIPKGFICRGFTCTSPKSYALELVSLDGNKTRIILKAKGFKLTSKAREKVNFSSFRDLIFSSNPENFITVTDQPMMKRDLKTGIIRSIYLQKRLKINADKRCNLIYSSHPYGYIES